MPVEKKPEKPIEQVIREDGRYGPEAFAFLREGLARAVKDVHGKDESREQRHVSGEQLCQSLKDLAVERWGQLAKCVLNHWNIRGTIDFGNMVFLMVQSGYMRKTADDRLDDFRNVYSFSEAFAPVDQFELKE